VRPLLRDLRDFFASVWDDWITLLSGIASVILTVLGFFGFPAWSFWVAALACLAVAMFRVWRKEHRANEGLSARLGGPEAQKEAAVRTQLAALSPSELLALRFMVFCGQATDARLADFCRLGGLPPMTGDGLADRVTFLTRDFALGAWSVKAGMDDAVRRVLSERDC
jgi:hypothetical protein